MNKLRLHQNNSDNQSLKWFLSWFLNCMPIFSTFLCTKFVQLCWKTYFCSCAKLNYFNNVKEKPAMVAKFVSASIKCWQVYSKVKGSNLPVSICICNYFVIAFVWKCNGLEQLWSLACDSDWRSKLSAYLCNIICKDCVVWAFTWSRTKGQPTWQ